MQRPPAPPADNATPIEPSGGVAVQSNPFFGHQRGDAPCHCRPVAAAPPTEKCSALSPCLARPPPHRLRQPLTRESPCAAAGRARRVPAAAPPGPYFLPEPQRAGRVTRRAAAQRRTAQALTRPGCEGYPGPNAKQGQRLFEKRSEFRDRLSLHFLHNPLSEVALVGLLDHIAAAGGSPDLYLRPPLSTAEESLDYRYRKQILNLGDVLNMVVCALGQVDCVDRNRNHGMPKLDQLFAQPLSDFVGIKDRDTEPPLVPESDHLLRDHAGPAAVPDLDRRHCRTARSPHLYCQPRPLHGSQAAAQRPPGHPRARHGRYSTRRCELVVGGIAGVRSLLIVNR